MAISATLPEEKGAGGLSQNEPTQIQVCQHPAVLVSPNAAFKKAWSSLEQGLPTDFLHLPPLLPKGLLAWARSLKDAEFQAVSGSFDGGEGAAASVVLAAPLLLQLPWKGCVFPLKGSLYPGPWALPLQPSLLELVIFRVSP